MFRIFSDAFLWLNRRISPFDDPFIGDRGRKICDALLFTWRVIGEKMLCGAYVNNEIQRDA